MTNLASLPLYRPPGELREKVIALRTMRLIGCVGEGDVQAARR